MDNNFQQHNKNSIQGFPRMQSIRVNSYEIKTSRNNLKIPVINGIHLHSMYNPAKEAQGVVAKYDIALQNNKNVFVLGLGFAYHVYEISRKMQSYHGNDFKIVVIEPNEQVYKDCINNNLFPNENITVYSGEDIEGIYRELNLVKFLIEKPVLISHPASMELYNVFFKNFLDYKAPTDLSSIVKYVTDRELKTYLYKGDSHDTLDNFLKNNVLSKDRFNNDIDHVMLGFTHLSNGDF